MFERFTDRARQVVVKSQEQARDLNHNYIGTEHILLGLMTAEPSLAVQAFMVVNLTIQELTDAVVEVVGRGREAPQGHIPFTPRAKKVLELSLREALQFGHNYIGPEHILLGLIREGEGMGIKALEILEVPPNPLRLKLISLIASTPQGAADTVPAAPATDQSNAARGRLANLDQLHPELVHELLAWYNNPGTLRRTSISDQFFVALERLFGQATPDEPPES